MSLLEIIEAIEGPLDAGVGSSQTLSAELQRKIGDALRAANCAARRVLQDVSLRQLAV